MFFILFTINLCHAERCRSRAFRQNAVGLYAVSFVPPDCHRDAQKDAAAIPNANPIIQDLICKYKAKI